VQGEEVLWRKREIIEWRWARSPRSNLLSARDGQQLREQQQLGEGEQRRRIYSPQSAEKRGRSKSEKRRAKSSRRNRKTRKKKRYNHNEDDTQRRCSATRSLQRETRNNSTLFNSITLGFCNISGFVN
jgi:hypothetical protein